MHEVILAGNGERARAWREVIDHAARLEIVAQVGRSGLLGALRSHPDALVAAPLPPRAALWAAGLLCAEGRRGIVESPLALDVPWPETCGSVQVAHGWLTLPGRVWASKLLARGVFGHVRIEARGLPEAPGGDPCEVLIHALALAVRLVPDCRIESVRAAGDARIELVLAGSRQTLEVSALADGHALEVALSGGSAEARFAWSPHTEKRELRGAGRAPSRSQHDVAPAEVRALRQLVDPEGSGGDDLTSAARAHGLARDALSRVQSRAPGRRSFALAARLERERPDEALIPLGLAGELPPGIAAETLRIPLPPEPLEIWALRAGKKPVVFLTLDPEAEPQVRNFLGDLHIERRERRVAIEAQDTWRDRRDRGTPRVELYAARDPALARRAAELQAHADPSAALVELGALMGYPECCVRAFAAQSDRANNTRNRYATAARTSQGAPWPWQLANTFAMLVPFFPCSYTCPQALAFARATLDAADAAHPGLASRLEQALAHPVLYFAHDRAVLLRDGVVEGSSTLHYAGVALPAESPASFQRFARALAAGSSLRLDATSLVIEGDGSRTELMRIDPPLGVILPFGR